MKNPKYIPLPPCPNTVSKRHTWVKDKRFCSDTIGHANMGYYGNHKCEYYDKCQYCNIVDDREEEET